MADPRSTRRTSVARSTSPAALPGRTGTISGRSEREKILKGKAPDLQKQADLAALGPQPVGRSTRVLVGDEPTIEGLIKLLGRGSRRSACSAPRAASSSARTA